MYPGLNSFRAFAFLAVFVFHTGRLSGGYLGVSAFFVLSGFLLTPILVEMKGSLSTPEFFKRFYGRRALRIFPLYFFYLCVVAVLCLVALQFVDDTNTLQLVRFLDQLPWGLSFTFNFYHASAIYERAFLITHFWSLAVEEQFYLLWPIVILFVPRNFLKHLLIALMILAPIFRWYVGTAHFGNLMPFFTEEINVRVYVLPFSQIDAFAAGGYFALYGRPRSPWSVWSLGVLVLALGMATEWLATGAVHQRALGYSPFMKDAYKHIWGYSVINLFSAYMLVHIRARTFLPSVFEHPVLDYLGRISYGLYVYHFGFIWLVLTYLPGLPRALGALLALALTVGTSAASYRYLEQPFIALKDRYFRRDGAPADANPRIAAAPATDG